MPKLITHGIKMIMILMLLCVSIPAIAQKSNVTINADSSPLKSVIEQIEKQTDYRFIYNKDVVDLNHSVTLKVTNAPLENVLPRLFDKSDIAYSVEKKQIVLNKKNSATETKKKKTIGNTQASESGSIQVSGTVIDENEEPLVGVTVMEAGTGNGTVTDLDGNFYLNVKSKDSQLKMSYLGYEPYEVKVGKKINFAVQMTPQLGELDEVVVVGYGKQVKASVVGSINTIEPEQLRVGHTANIQDNLAGQLAGVIAYKPSGEPGYDQSEFWIRGISSFAGNTTPLVLIDGVERSLNDLDAAEIESFSILKDAAASAVYGVRGANGVILVNTKRGKIGAPTVSFRFEQAFRQPTSLPEFANATEYMALHNKLAAEKGLINLPFDPDYIHKTAIGYDPELYADVDWIDTILKDNSTSSRANLTVSGGSDFLRYSMTASWYSENGIMNRDKSLPYDTSTKNNKYNVRANIDMNVTKTTLLRFNVGGYIQRVRKQNESTYEVYNKAFQTPPYVHPPVYSNGAIPRINNSDNPWAMLTQRGYTNCNHSMLEALVSVEQDLKMLLPGLKVRGLFSFDNYNSIGTTRGRIPTYYAPANGRDEEGNLVLGQPQNTDGTDYLSHSKYVNDYGYQRTYFEASINYDQVFNSKHRVGAMFLYNMTNNDTYDIQPYRHQGIAGRFSYTFDSRYVAEFNFGYNGSENFAKGKRYGFFPSGAIGWIISNEKFFEQLSPTITKLKLRASVGKVGNDQIGSGRRFAYITTVNANAGGYSFGTTNNYSAGAGITEGEIGVSNLTWETVTKYNLGLELGLLSALDFQIDVFKEHRTNIFMQRNTIPTQIGFATMPYANYGKVDNHGLEFSLDFHKGITKDFMIGLRANFTYARNKIIECDEPESVKGTHRSRTGRSIGELWGYQADGLYSAEDFNADGTLVAGLPTPELSANPVRPGDIKYVDRNNDGVINSKDEGYIGGVTTPRIIYGFGGNMIYKHLDFSFFFQGTGDSYRGLAVTGSNFLIPGSGQGIKGNIFSNYTDAWTEENPSQDVFWPRLTYGENSHNQQGSTFFKKDISFLRLKTVELGFTLPQKWSRAYGSSQTRFYVSGNDLFRFSKFKLWDPELNTGNGMIYPLQRSVMFGFDLKF